MTTNRWLLREVRYPTWRKQDARTMTAATEIEMDVYGPVWSDTDIITQIEAIWQPWNRAVTDDRQPFPTFQDMLDIIYESERRWGKQPDIIVVSPPVGTKYFGVEIR